MISLFKNCLLIFISFTSFNLSAQDSSKTKQADNYKVTVLADRKVEIEFTAIKNIYHVLIVLADTLGNTEFMDSQYNFKGTYKHLIDLNSSDKKNYYLKIIADKDQINKKLKIK